MKKMLTTRHDKIFAVVSLVLVLFAVLVGLSAPTRVSAGIVPPDTQEMQVGNAKVNGPNPNSVLFKKPDPANPGKCVGGDKSCKPPCGISKSSLGTCESVTGGCQTNGLPSCDALEDKNQKGDGKGDEKPKEEGKGGEPPKMPELPKPQPKSPEQPNQDPCQQGGGSTDPSCAKAESNTGSILNSLLGGATKIGESISGAAQSAADQLQTMISGVNDSGGSGHGSFNTPPSGSVSNSGSQGSGSQGNSPTTGLGAGAIREGGTVPVSGPPRDTAGNSGDFTRPTAAAGFGPPPSSVGNLGSQSGTVSGGISGALSTAMSALGGLLSNFSSIFHF
jgi:hypothetical protein